MFAHCHCNIFSLLIGSSKSICFYFIICSISRCVEFDNVPSNPFLMACLVTICVICFSPGRILFPIHKCTVLQVLSSRVMFP